MGAVPGGGSCSGEGRGWAIDCARWRAGARWGAVLPADGVKDLRDRGRVCDLGERPQSSPAVGTGERLDAVGPAEEPRPVDSGACRQELAAEKALEVKDRDDVERMQLECDGAVAWCGRRGDARDATGRWRPGAVRAGGAAEWWER